MAANCSRSRCLTASGTCSQAQYPLTGSVRTIIAPPHPCAVAGLLDQLGARSHEIDHQPQPVIQLVEQCDRFGGVVAGLADMFAHHVEVLLLSEVVVFLAMRAGAREVDLLLLAVALQMGR